MSGQSTLYCVRCGELNRDRVYWIKCLGCGHILEKRQIVNLISPSPPIKSEQSNIENDVKNTVNNRNVANVEQNEFDNINVLPVIGPASNHYTNSCHTQQTVMDKIKNLNYTITENDIFVKDWKWRKFEDAKICSLCDEYGKYNNMTVEDKWISVSCKLAIYTQNKRDEMKMEPNAPWRTTQDVIKRYCDIILPRMNNNEHELSLLDKLKTGRYVIKKGKAASKHGRNKIPWKQWEISFILECDKKYDIKCGNNVIKKTEKGIEISNKLALETKKQRESNDPRIPWRTTSAVINKLAALIKQSQEKIKTQRKKKRRTRSNCNVDIDIDLSIQSDECHIFPPKKKRKN